MTDHPLYAPKYEPVSEMIDPQALRSWMRSRRSVRRFTSSPVSEAVLEDLLLSASRAPSAHNRQPWRFAVLRSREGRDRLARAMGEEYARALEAEGQEEAAIEAALARSRARILEAPAAILLCMASSVMDRYADENRNRGEVQMAAQSVAIAGGYLLLAAHAEGLGAVWVCAPLFAPAAVREALDLPADWESQALILLGFPEGHTPQRPRQPLDTVRMVV